MTFDSNESFFVRQAYEDGIAEGMRRAAEGGSLEEPAHCTCPLCGARSTMTRNEYLWALEHFARAAIAEDDLFNSPPFRKNSEAIGEALDKLRQAMAAHERR